MFDLPLHPLLVHAAVVFIPLAALGTLLVVLSRPVRERYAGLVVGVGAVAAASGLAAMLTGPLLAAHVGVAGSAFIAHHQLLGTWTAWITLALAVALPAHLLARHRGAGERPGALGLATGVVALGLALAALTLVALTGEAGASAVWG